MIERKNVRMSSSFVNKTDQPIYLYNSDTGEIWVFPPSVQGLPKTPNDIPGSTIVYYVFDEENYLKLAETNRSLEDIAFIKSKKRGRDGIPIAYLSWGKNPEISISLCNAASLTSSHY